MVANRGVCGGEGAGERDPPLGAHLGATLPPLMFHATPSPPASRPFLRSHPRGPISNQKEAVGPAERAPLAAPDLLVGLGKPSAPFEVSALKTRKWGQGRACSDNCGGSQRLLGSDKCQAWPCLAPSSPRCPRACFPHPPHCSHEEQDTGQSSHRVTDTGGPRPCTSTSPAQQELRKRWLLLRLVLFSSYLSCKELERLKQHGFFLSP